ncbi:hypothetical protein [Labrenzia sp. THAF35]|uniref:hypothetical protein n=1 Tax=Labrenzia sp. THAF35 TaxID=2587854 RepID=UPI0012681317|nr:hypothetical protein [Labrenzia sp. THAF35]
MSARYQKSRPAHTKGTIVTVHKETARIWGWIDAPKSLDADQQDANSGFDELEFAACITA